MTPGQTKPLFNSRGRWERNRGLRPLALSTIAGPPNLKKKRYIYIFFLLPRQLIISYYIILYRWQNYVKQSPKF